MDAHRLDVFSATYRVGARTPPSTSHVWRKSTRRRLGRAGDDPGAVVEPKNACRPSVGDGRRLCPTDRRSRSEVADLPAQRSSSRPVARRGDRSSCRFAARVATRLLALRQSSRCTSGVLTWRSRGTRGDWPSRRQGSAELTRRSAVTRGARCRGGSSSRFLRPTRSMTCWPSSGRRSRIRGRGRCICRSCTTRACHTSSSPRRGPDRRFLFVLAGLRRAAHQQPGGRSRPSTTRAWPRSLLTRVLAEAPRLGAARALLEVRRSNADARRLYERFGFSVAGTRRNYYTQPVEDAAGCWLSGDTDIRGIRRA